MIYEEFIKDPRVREAKESLMGVLEEYKKNITQVKPADASKKIPYEKMVQSFSEMRGTPLFFPYIGSGMGNGPLVELMDGSVKYDFISGIGVHFFGHSNLGIASASIDAALSNTVMQGPLQQNSDSLELMRLLREASGMDCCFLTTAGAMANENALKILFQKSFPASRLLAFEHCFAGRTFAMSQITDKPLYRKGLPKTVDVDYIPFYDYKNPEASIESAKKALLMLIKRYPKQHAAMIFELIQGEGGFYPGTTAFFKPLMEILKEHGIHVLADEVQTFGRTSKLFAFQHFELDQYVDVVTIGKMSQTCATLFRKALVPEKGLISQTFSSSTASIKTSLFIMKSLMEGGFFGENGKIMQLQRHFHEKLSALSVKKPELVQGPYCMGGMVAFTAYDGSSEKANDFVKRLFEAGVLSFIAGDNPTRVRFLIPAGAMDNHDIDKAFEIIEKTLEGHAPF